jgi:hypothetical protein
MSFASWTSFAPYCASRCVPSDVAEKIEPGTANTSRPCSAAMRAVISEPLRLVASTITVPRARPEITRLRIGKFSASAACRAETR